MSEELRAALRAELGDAGLVQLAAAVAVENFLGRFNRAVGIEAQGYSDGAACLVPEHRGAGEPSPRGESMP